VIVEVDGHRGHRGHRTPAQLYANHQRDLILRSNGFVVLRFAKAQFTATPTAVADDVRLNLAREL
jgi:very-short-patch-repair endonuclease